MHERQARLRRSGKQRCEQEERSETARHGSADLVTDLHRGRVDPRVRREQLVDRRSLLRGDRAERVAARDGVRPHGAAPGPWSWVPRSGRSCAACAPGGASSRPSVVAGGAASCWCSARADEQDRDRRREEEEDAGRRRGRAPDAGARPSTSRRRPRPRRAAASPRRRRPRASRARGRCGRRRSPSARPRRARSPARS